MNTRISLLGCWGLLGTVACSGAAGGVGSPAATAAPVARVQAAEPVTRAKTTSAPLDYHAESESDRVFIENAERAIGEYTAFLARAGESPEYANAAKRSREQIEDLRAAILFVREGARNRTPH